MEDRSAFPTYDMYPVFTLFSLLVVLLTWFSRDTAGWICRSVATCHGLHRMAQIAVPADARTCLRPVAASAPAYPAGAPPGMSLFELLRISVRNRMRPMMCRT